MNAWEALERKLKRYLPLDEARQQQELHELSRYELAYLRDRFLVQFEDFAGHILPDEHLVKNKVARAVGSRTEAHDPLSDPLLLAV